MQWGATKTADKPFHEAKKGFFEGKWQRLFFKEIWIQELLSFGPIITDWKCILTTAL